MTIDQKIAELQKIVGLIKKAEETFEEWEEVCDYLKNTTFRELKVLKFLDCPDADFVIAEKKEYEAGPSKDSEAKLWERWTIQRQKQWN